MELTGGEEHVDRRVEEDMTEIAKGDLQIAESSQTIGADQLYTSLLAGLSGRRGSMLLEYQILEEIPDVCRTDVLILEHEAGLDVQ